MEQDRPTTIDLTDAIRYARRWRKEEGSYYKHHELHAFYIPKEDFRGILNEGVQGVRGYLGVGDDGKEKLMFVGTRKNHTTGEQEDLLPTERADYFVYDLTLPCPNMCDSKSVLNTAPPQQDKE